MSLLMGAPIMNNGYYDIPIETQKKNNLPNINEFDFNKKINLTINDNKQSYQYNQMPTTPSSSLYYETDKSQSGYYQDPIYLAYDAGVPLIKKKEQICNTLNIVESFDGSYGLNTQFIPNVNRNYWNNTSNNQYQQQMPQQYEEQRQMPQQYQQQMPQQYEQPQQQYHQQMPQQQQQYNQQMPQQYEQQRQMPQQYKQQMPQQQSIQYEQKPLLRKKILKKKSRRIKKIKKEQIDNKILWNIILILFIIIIMLIFKVAFDNKIIVYK